MHLGNLQTAMIEDKQWSKHPAPVCVDVNITILEIVTNADLWPDSARAATSLELANQLVWPLMQAEDVAVDMDSRAGCPAIGVVVDARFLEKGLDIVLRDLFRDIDHLCGVLD